MSEQLTLKDWEKLFNMIKANEASNKELCEKIAQLEARIPKTGLLSHSMLTRIVTVCGYLFVAQIAWSFLGAFILNYGLIILGLAMVIFLLVIIVRWIKRSKSDYNDARLWAPKKM
jgi:hypothetical protein